METRIWGVPKPMFEFGSRFYIFNRSVVLQVEKKTVFGKSHFIWRHLTYTPSIRNAYFPSHLALRIPSLLESLKPCLWELMFSHSCLCSSVWDSSRVRAIGLPFRTPNLNSLFSRSSVLEICNDNNTCMCLVKQWYLLESAGLWSFIIFWVIITIYQI